MLGLVKSVKTWSWTAYGKHPAARDFFMLGEDSPLMRSFTGWVEEGYGILSAKDKGQNMRNSWRFWARGAAKETIICGIVKDSGDSVGRHFPFLMIGTGHLKGWEEQWDLLPFACEKTWSHIEYLSAQSFNDFKKIGAELRNIRQPSSEWQELKEKREEAAALEETGALKNIASLLSEKYEGFIPIEQNPNRDQNALIGCWHYLFKKHSPTVPNAAFMGGAFDKTFLVFYKKPLTLLNFVQLWDVSLEGK